MKEEKIYTARHNYYSNDLFWEFITPTVFNKPRKIENLKIIGGGEILRWSGYNDSDWWNKWSKQDKYNQRTDKLGQIWEIDFNTNEIILISKKAGNFI